VSKLRDRSTSMTVDMRRSTLRLTAASAPCGDRFGRNPYEFEQKSASSGSVCLD
jgi:hypothetical protein